MHLNDTIDCKKSSLGVFKRKSEQAEKAIESKTVFLLVEPATSRRAVFSNAAVLGPICI